MDSSRQVGDVADHARHGQTGVGFLRLVVVVAVIPGRVGVDGLATHLAEGDQHGAVVGSRGNRDGGVQALRVMRGPFQHLHAAHGAAGHTEQLVDAQMVDQLDLGAHHVADRHHGKVQPVGLAGRRVEAGRPGRAIARADDIAADDEEAVGVEGLARPDAIVPPAELVGVAVEIAGGVRAAAQRVADQDGVGAVGVERAVRLVGDRHRAQRLAALKTERFVFGEGERLGGDGADAVSGHRSTFFEPENQRSMVNGQLRIVQRVTSSTVHCQLTIDH